MSAGALSGRPDFPRRGAELLAEAAGHVREIVEAPREGDVGQRHRIRGAGLEGAPAFLGTKMADVPRNRHRLPLEKSMQVTRAHAEGGGNGGRAEITMVQVARDVLPDLAELLRGRERVVSRSRAQHTAEKIEDVGLDPRDHRTR